MSNIFNIIDSRGNIFLSKEASCTNFKSQ